MQKAIKYMRYGAESSRYIAIGCVEKVIKSPKLENLIVNPVEVVSVAEFAHDVLLGRGPKW